MLPQVQALKLHSLIFVGPLGGSATSCNPNVCISLTLRSCSQTIYYLHMRQSNFTNNVRLCLSLDLFWSDSSWISGSLAAKCSRPVYQLVASQPFGSGQVGNSESIRSYSLQNSFLSVTFPFPGGVISGKEQNASGRNWIELQPIRSTQHVT